ncbi:MAG: nicotinamide-nucleotide amidohydrolase family protein [Pseudomonadota bacterium]
MTGTYSLLGLPTAARTDHEVAELARRLVALDKSVATAESCTGGWIAKTLTDVAGSSGWFGFGVVSYSNAAKQKLLGVRHATLASYGAVSEAVVREMADGVRMLSGADFGVAVSGIAGPGGGSADKPVGTVWCAWSGQSETFAQMQRFSGDRNEVREKTVHWSLAKLNQYLERQQLL